MKHVAEVIAYSCAILFMVGFTGFVLGGIIYNVLGWHWGNVRDEPLPEAEMERRQTTDEEEA